MPGFASLLVTSAAVRVASLNMCADEYLLLLARPRRSPASAACRVTRRTARCGGWPRFPGNRGDLESALKTRPNLLITMGGGGKSTALIAGNMGLRTSISPFP